MLKKKPKEAPEINGGAMADIAFLLLIFFLVATTIASDKGVTVMLPPKAEKTDVKVKERNVFNIIINSQDMILAQEEQINDLGHMREMVKKFVLNQGKDSKSSESPEKAIISLKTDRGTSYDMYISVVDELKLAYAEMRAAAVGLPLEDFQNLDKDKPAQKEKLDKAKDLIPYKVSDAEPTEI
ncbi:biopolymer transporter ExbD [Flammeovirga yaeyamensis]|uniref:Biopolymer transporter ExbD n=1 Tax=Flammeovirga yaeyamensis TaxID=367791 RepID=A0AAX1N6C8_9BACT|nr:MULTISPECIES: biopolymer transporter ExbD [Flammeovirga]ANQ49422.1 biopolymer transporter ExbD [Flammeovirga sp. MY04]MBB3697691.1 biopolymer transport protein ExbD [Flammeovirga yaeyamensis]NMF35949.1 biopolymer transporter ExbD [Flammeovirga yaeyamensis]QWG03103.1 biopolymer transporter ExbD [Flammeovirga yaeyamensis]